MSYKFKQSKEVGDNGELFLAGLFPNEWSRIDGKKGDLITKEHVLLPNPIKVEVKTDNHDKALAAFTENRIPNEFHERYSNVETRSQGGPWQALDNDCPIFLYFYTCGDVRLASIYRTEKLIQRLEELMASGKYKSFRVPNKTYFTLGYPIPRTALADLHVTFDLTKPPQTIIPTLVKLLE